MAVIMCAILFLVSAGLVHYGSERKMGSTAFSNTVYFYLGILGLPTFFVLFMNALLN